MTTLYDIEDTIQNCLNTGFERGVTKKNIEDALDQLIPCLAHVGRIESECERDYLEKKMEGIDEAYARNKRGERLIITYSESYARGEKVLYTRAKRLPKSLDVAISALQSRLKETTNI